MLQIGLFGTGHLGKIHLQQWLEIPGVQVVGFYDPDDTQAATTIATYQVPRYTDADALIRACDAIDIVTPTTTHHQLALQVLQAHKHVFIEKPLAQSLEEAREIVDLVAQTGVKCQIGHVERYNPALLALGPDPVQPVFIESHRLAQFNPRGTDVSVILDLMIHDLDIVLHLVKSPVKAVSASGVAVVSQTVDIVSARIEFENGCVANLTTSRISLKKMRKMRLFRKDAYIGIDFLDKKTEVIQMKQPGAVAGMMDFPIDLPSGESRIISVQMPAVQPSNAIRDELADFAAAILQDRPVKVPATDGLAAMEIAHQILAQVDLHLAQQTLLA
ncbi:MAG: Gfo/Idh/MocA family oxidoreductase [Sphingobacteriales bacterium]|nr:MAG: Gfo/Idh/MocA family oxidoreductase [Sphingobacteriales bacterium]